MADTNTNSGSNNGSTKTPKPEQQQQQKPQPPAVKPHLDLFEDLRKGANTFPSRDNE